MRSFLFPHAELVEARGNKERNPRSDAAQVPRSVINPVTRRAGVTSKPGLAAGLLGAAISTLASSPAAVRPVILRISSGERSSIGMSRPEFKLQSIVELGSAT